MLRFGPARAQVVIGPPGLAPHQGADVEALRTWAATGLGDRQIGYEVPGVQAVRLGHGHLHPLQGLAPGSGTVVCDMALAADTDDGQISHADIEDWMSGTHIVINQIAGSLHGRVYGPVNVEPVLMTVMVRLSDTGPWWPRYSGWVRRIRRQRRRDGTDTVTYDLQDTLTWLGQAALIPALIPAPADRAWAQEDVHARFGRILDLISYLGHRVTPTIDAAAPASAAWDLAVPRATRGRTSTDTRLAAADTADGQTGLNYLRRVAAACAGEVLMHHGIGPVSTMAAAAPATVAIPASGAQPGAAVQIDWGGVITLAPGVTAPITSAVDRQSLGGHATPVRLTPAGDAAAGKVSVTVADIDTDLDLHRHLNLTQWTRLAVGDETTSEAVGLNTASTQWVRHAGWSPDRAGGLLAVSDAAMRQLSDIRLSSWQKPRRAIALDLGELAGDEALWAAAVLSAGHIVAVDYDGRDIDARIGAVTEQMAAGSWRVRYGAVARDQITRVGLLEAATTPPAPVRPPPVEPPPVTPGRYQWLHITDTGYEWRDDPPTYAATVSTLGRAAVRDTSLTAATGSFTLPPIGQIEWSIDTNLNVLTALRLVIAGRHTTLPDDIGFSGTGPTAVWSRDGTEGDITLLLGATNHIGQYATPDRTRFSWPGRTTESRFRAGLTLSTLRQADFAGIRRLRPTPPPPDPGDGNGNGGTTPPPPVSTGGFTQLGSANARVLRLLRLRDTTIDLPADYATSLLALRFGDADSEMALIHGGDLASGSAGSTAVSPLIFDLQTGHADAAQTWELAVASDRSLLAAADPADSRATPLVVWDWETGHSLVGSGNVTLAVGMVDTGIDLPADYATSLFAVRLGGLGTDMMLMHGGDLGTDVATPAGTAVTLYTRVEGRTVGVIYRLKVSSTRRLYIWGSIGAGGAGNPAPLAVYKIDSPTAVGTATPDLSQSTRPLIDTGITLPADYAAKILAVRFGGGDTEVKMIYGGDLVTAAANTTDRTNAMILACYTEQTITNLTTPDLYYLAVTSARKLLAASLAGGIGQVNPTASPLAVWTLN